MNISSDKYSIPYIKNKSNLKYSVECLLRYTKYNCYITLNFLIVQKRSFPPNFQLTIVLRGIFNHLLYQISPCSVCIVQNL